LALRVWRELPCGLLPGLNGSPSLLWQPGWMPEGAGFWNLRSESARRELRVLCLQPAMHPDGPQRPERGLRPLGLPVHGGGGRQVRVPAWTVLRGQQPVWRPVHGTAAHHRLQHGSAEQRGSVLHAWPCMWRGAGWAELRERRWRSGLEGDYMCNGHRGLASGRYLRGVRGAGLGLPSWLQTLAASTGRWHHSTRTWQGRTRQRRQESRLTGG
jgi:hypothetical protein